MSRISETLKFEINGKSIEALHEGLKKFEDQVEGSLDVLKSAIEQDLNANKNEGFIPYCNFECGIDWKVLE